MSAEHAARRAPARGFRSLERDVDDLETLEEMAAEDESIAAELEEQRASIEARLAELEEARLFSGEYDGGDAVVTVNAGAGGTDSQDWAEMLLRMEMRWAERRGMKVELKEASAGEEAASSRRPSSPAARTPTGCSRPRRACTGWCASRPSTPQSRRHTAFAGVEVAPLRRGRRGRRDRARRHPDRHLPRLGRRRPAREQDRLGGADHAQADRHRRAVPERALAVGQQGHRDGDAAREADRGRGARRQEAIAKERARRRTSAWGSQIRSYVLHPYTMVKDHRTNVEAATPRACSTAISTSSSVPSCCGARATALA